MVVGASRVGEGKAIALLESGARVTVISPAVTSRIEELARQSVIRLHRRVYQEGDLVGAFLAVAATGDSEVNRRIWREAEKRRVLLNAVDDLEHCHFIAPAVHRQGDLSIAVSTAGRSPALAVRVRDRIAATFGREYGTWLEVLADLRPRMVQIIPDPALRATAWYRIVDSDAIDLVRGGDVEAARRLAWRLAVSAAGPRPPAAELPPVDPRGRMTEDGEAGRAAPVRRGTVYIVGAGPGDPGLITRRGFEILCNSEVVVYDRLVDPALVDEAPAVAERIFVGKHPRDVAVTQHQINRILINRALAGKRVVRLKGGDPFVLGRGGEECEALRAAGVPFVVVPGVTSATAVPGAAGIPVTHRGVASAFAVVSGHQCGEAPEIDWDALAKLPTIVVLMGLTTLADIAQRLMRAGKPPDTPAAVVASGTLPKQRAVFGTLQTIAQVARRAALTPPATVVIGHVVELSLTASPAASQESRSQEAPEPLRPAQESATAPDGT